MRTLRSVHGFCTMGLWPYMYTVEPLYNEVLGTMKITLLYQVSHYIGVKKQRNIKSWDQQNYLVIRGLCYIRPRYNEVPLYIFLRLVPTVSKHECWGNSHGGCVYENVYIFQCYKTEKTCKHQMPIKFVTLPCYISISFRLGALLPV